MSLARAFTNRRQKRMEISSPTNIPIPPPPPDMPALPGQIPSTPIVVRAVSVRKPNAPPIKMSQISSPVELVSTTNMLSYNAPDIKAYRKQAQTNLPPTPPESAGSRSSSDDSDSRSSNSSHKSSGTLTDASSVDLSPISSPHPNDFSSYFAKSASQPAPVRRSKSTLASHRKSLSIDDPTPEVPRRAPSHSKRAHQQVHRQKSLGHISQSSIPRISREERASADFFKITPDPSHPFNKELEQVNELAEELTTTVRNVEEDEDTMKMLEKGLAKFRVDDYLIEIQPLFAKCFFPTKMVEEEMPMWI